MTTSKYGISLICFAVTCLTPAFSQTGAWSSPTALSTGGQGWQAAAAIDGIGNSVAIWDEIAGSAQIWSRSKPSGGSWGGITDVYPSLQANSIFPSVQMSAAGLATAVWTDTSGVWTADRPPASGWDSPQLLVSGVSNPIFVMNSQGAAAIVWTVGGARSTSSEVLAMLRHAGGAWGGQQVVASGPHVTADHAQIGANGAVIVTWESYNATCGKYGCSVSAFALHASRQNPNAGLWQDSGSLMGPDRTRHDARVALDATGGAAMVAVSSTGAYSSATQGNAGGAWGAFKAIADPQGSTITAGLASDDAGHVMLVYEFIQYPTSQVFAVNGSISSNAWSSPAVICGSDTNVGQIYFAVSPSGAAVAAWLNSSGTPAVRAVLRAANSETWSSPVTISEPASYISPEAAAVSSSGSAIVVYSGYDASNVHTEYATTYRQ